MDRSRPTASLGPPVGPLWAQLSPNPRRTRQDGPLQSRPFLPARSRGGRLLRWIQNLNLFQFRFQVIS